MGDNGYWHYKQAYLVKTKVEDNKFSIPLFVFGISYFLKVVTAANFACGRRIPETTNKSIP